MAERGKVKAEQLQGYPADSTKFLAGLVNADGSNQWLKPSGGGVFPSSLAAVSHKFVVSYDASTGLFVAQQPTDADLSISDITTNNVSSSAHGFTPKLPADATKYLDGTGNYTVPPGSGGGSPGGSAKEYQYNNAGAFGAVTNSAPVPTAGWTIRNGAVFNNFSGRELGFSCPANGTINFRLITQTLGAPPYTVIASIRCTLPLTAIGSAQVCGLAIFDGTRFEDIEILNNNANPTLNVRLSANPYTSNSGGTILAGPTANVTPIGAATFKIVDDSTHRTFYYYVNGGFTQFFQEASGATITPNAVGLVGLDTGAGSSVQMVLTYWSVS